MSELQDQLALLGGIAEDDRRWDRTIYLVLEELVSTCERLQAEVDSLQRTLNARTEHLT